MPDEDAMRRVQEGDMDALAVVYERYRRPLALFIHRFVGSYEEAADLLHETILKVYERRRQYQYPRKVSSWLFRIARNLCLDRVRAFGRRKTCSLPAFNSEKARAGLGDTELSQAKASFARLFASREPPPEERQARREMVAVLRRALLCLPLELREALLLRVVQGMTYREVADILRVAPRTVRKRVAQGLGGLRRNLAGS